MNSKIKWIVITVVSIAMFVAIYFLYTQLKADYAPEQLGVSQSAEQTDEENTNASVPTAPDFTVLDENGNSVKLSDCIGKPIVLNFWASWCYYCKMEMPDFNEAYHNNPDVQFMMVNVTDGYRETEELAKSYITDEGFDFPVYYDTQLEAANAYGASGLPMTVFIDKDGNVVTYASGMLTAENLAKGIELIK